MGELHKPNWFWLVVPSYSFVTSICHLRIPLDLIWSSTILRRPRKPGIRPQGSFRADHVAPSIRKVRTKVADKRRSLYRYSSLANSGRRVYLVFSLSKKKINSMVWVRKRTISTERPPLAGEVTANFCGKRVPRGQRDGSLLPYSRYSTQEPLLFYQVAPQLYSRGWVDPVPDPLLFFSGSAGNRIRASGSVAKNSDH
jgi:hypothetical protein